MQEVLDQIRLAVALRTARAAVGWSQDELATHLGISKTTLARVETMEGGLRADQLSQLIRFYKDLGINVDLFYSDSVSVTINPDGLLAAQERLSDAERRRPDRKRRSGGSSGEGN